MSASDKDGVERRTFSLRCNSAALCPVLWSVFTHTNPRVRRTIPNRGELRENARRSKPFLSLANVAFIVI